MLSRRGPGRPPLAEGEAPIKRTVLLTPELNAAAGRVKAGEPWATWLRGLVERATFRRRPDAATIAALARHGIGWSELDGVNAEDVVRVLEERSPQTGN